MPNFGIHLISGGSTLEAATQAIRDLSDVSESESRDIVEQFGVVADSVTDRRRTERIKTLEQVGALAMIVPSDINLLRDCSLRLRVVTGNGDSLVGVHFSVEISNEAFDEAVEAAVTDEDGVTETAAFADLACDHFGGAAPFRFRVGGDRIYEVLRTAFDWEGYTSFPDTVLQMTVKPAADDGQPTDDRFFIAGRVLDSQTKQGLSGFRVRAGNRDARYNDSLSTVISGNDGWFDLSFGSVRFANTPIDRRTNAHFRVLKQM